MQMYFIWWYHAYTFGAMFYIFGAFFHIYCYTLGAFLFSTYWLSMISTFSILYATVLFYSQFFTFMHVFYLFHPVSCISGIYFFIWFSPIILVILFWDVQIRHLYYFEICLFAIYLFTELQMKRSYALYIIYVYGICNIFYYLLLFFISFQVKILFYYSFIQIICTFALC